jgi:hypothetical protein
VNRLDDVDADKPARLRILAGELRVFAKAASIAVYATQMFAAADELERRASFLAAGGQGYETP